MTKPDLTTEIIGYRQWYVTPDLKLRAAGFGPALWTPGVNTAVCGRVSKPSHSFHYSSSGAMYEKHKPNPCGDTPGSDCKCGFYALHDPSDFWYGKRPETAFAQAIQKQTAIGSDPLVSGIVVAWGKVEVHHQGFRSEFARIAALALPEGKRDTAVIRAAAADYGVLCVSVEELPKIAAEFGTTVPIDMRPDKPKPRDAADDYTQLMRKMLNDQKRLYAAQKQHWSSSTWAEYSNTTYGKPARRKPWWHIGGF